MSDIQQLKQELACGESDRQRNAAEELLTEYAWVGENSKMRTWPPGLLKPNSLGLFDMYGNVAEWQATLAHWDSRRVAIGGGTFGEHFFVFTGYEQDGT